MENINLFNNSPIMHQLHYTAKQVWRCIAGEAMYRDNCGLIYIYIYIYRLIYIYMHIYLKFIHGAQLSQLKRIHENFKFFLYIYNINMLYYSNTDNIVQRKPWARGEPTSRCFSLQECSQFIKFCMGPIKWWHLSKRSDSDYISYLIDIYIYYVCLWGYLVYIYTQ